MKVNCLHESNQIPLYQNRKQRICTDHDCKSHIESSLFVTTDSASKDTLINSLQDREKIIKKNVLRTRKSFSNSKKSKKY